LGVVKGKKIQDLAVSKRDKYLLRKGGYGRGGRKDIGRDRPILLLCYGMGKQ